MKHKSLIIAALIVLTLATISLALWPHTNNQTQAPAQTVTIGQHKFAATIAKTPQQRIDGLGGWTQLGQNQGMYFPLDDYPASFWMKGMLIDIDILWIDQNKIVGVNKNVPAPETGTPDHKLKSYPSPVDQPDAVFEIPAGRSDELSIKVGDKVETNF